MIEDSDIRTQSAHVFTEPSDSEVMEVLTKHFGEHTSRGLSIDARQAEVCLSRCLASMLVLFESDESVELLRAIEGAALDQRRIAVAEFNRAGRA